MPDRNPKRGRWRLSPTSRLTASGRARRRFNCATQDDWDERANTAALLLAENAAAWEGAAGRPVAIGDFGAGNERMRSVLAAALSAEHTYHPYDLHPQRSTTLRLDVAEGLPDRDFDIAICLGLLEYLRSIPALATSLNAHCRFALTSYVALDSPVGLGRPEREERHWSTHATEAELRDIFVAAGFEPVASTRSDNNVTTLTLWGPAPKR